MLQTPSSSTKMNFLGDFHDCTIEIDPAPPVVRANQRRETNDLSLHDDADA